MLSFLKNHPFAVDAFFERSLVLSFAVPAAILQEKIPPCLKVDTFDDKWGFMAVALVQTRNLRPAGYPTWLGTDFFLIGYRLFVRYKTQSGRNLRGLYILRSQTNSRRMELIGNLFTRYNYTTVDINQKTGNGVEVIESKAAKMEIEIDSTNSFETDLPAGSPFHSWKEARRFAGPLPFTFIVQPQDKSVLIIEGVRENWSPQPVKVDIRQRGFLDELKIPSSVLANAFMVRDVHYRWKRGTKEFLR